MSGLGSDDAFLAALRDAPARPMKRKAKAVLGGPSKRKATSVPVPTPSRGTQQASRRAGGTPNEETKRAVPRSDTGKKKDTEVEVVPSHSMEKSETEALAPFMGVMVPSMKEAVDAALSIKMPPDVFDVVLNARDYCAKLMSAIALLSSAMAQISNIAPSELKDFMSKVTVNAEVPRRSHDAELRRVEEEYEERLRALRGQLTDVLGRLADKEQQLACVSDKVVKVEAAAEKRINRLTDVRSDLEGKLGECKTELEGLKVKHEEYKAFLQAELPNAKHKAFRECMITMLKKIQHTYPGADMSYFADDTDAPEVELDPALLAPYEDETETVVEDEKGEEENAADEAAMAEDVEAVDIEK